MVKFFMFIVSGGQNDDPRQHKFFEYLKQKKNYGQSQTDVLQTRAAFWKILNRAVFSYSWVPFLTEGCPGYDLYFPFELLGAR